MTEHEHVPRLDEGSDELMGELLRAARREVPDAARMDALALALVGKMTPPTPDGPDGADGSGGSDGGPSGGETMPPGADAAAGAAGGAAPTATAGSVAPAAAAATGAGTSVAVKATLATVAALVVAGGVYTATRPPQPAPKPPEATTAAAAVALPSVQPKRAAATEPAPVLSIEDLPELPAAPNASGSRPIASGSGAPESKKRSTAEAMADLRRAQDALGSNPARAVQLIAEHRRDYPRSAFSQERDVLEIDALLRLGRRSEAVAKGDQFARFYPKSAHRRRIDALLGR